MNLRTLKKVELKGKPCEEYVVSVDVARSNKSSNNQCSVAVLKIKRNGVGRVTMVQIVNLINIPSILNFKVQAQEIMKIKNLYNAKAIVVDANGLGRPMPLMIEMSYSKIGEPRNLGCVA